MLTPEQLDELDKQYICGELKMYQVCSLLEHAHAQQARIAELESNAEAHALEMKAGKAMLAAETARADAAEQQLEEYKRWSNSGRYMNGF